MPRQIATQLAQQISRQVRGGYLKQTPLVLQTLLNHPPTPLPARAPSKRPSNDLARRPSPAWESVKHSDDERLKYLRHLDEAPTGKEDLRLWQKQKSKWARKPSLGAPSIEYLEDDVRKRFFNDHPWETLKPRLLIEADKLTPRANTLRQASPDLRTGWGRNPGPEEVIACVVNLHRNHSLSLLQAYHNTLSAYYGLRAEHEHASRAAVFEARSYGASFGQGPDGAPSSTPEIDRGFRKEAEELEKGAKFLAKAPGAASATPQRALSNKSTKSWTTRTRNTWAPQSQGVKYLQAALAARDATESSAMVGASSNEKAPDSTSLIGLFSRRSGAKETKIDNAKRDA